MSPKPIQQELPAYFGESKKRPGSGAPEAREEDHRRAKRGRRASLYIPSGQDVGEIKRCSEDTVSPEWSGSGAPEAREADRQIGKRYVTTPSNSDDDEPPSPALLGPKRPLSPSLLPSQEKAHRDAKKPRQCRVVSGLPEIVYEGPIEVFYDGVPSQEEVHAAAKRRGSTRRGSSPLRELSPEPTKRLLDLF